MEKNKLIEEVKGHLKNDTSIDEIHKELDNYICLLTKRNASLVESCISVDPRYPNRMGKFIETLGIYQNGSSIDKIISVLDRNKLEKFIWIVASENSIQGKKPIVKTYIADFILNTRNFYERLNNGDWILVEEMEKAVYQRNINNRHECSWCSKVCKYLHEFLFNKDKYYIYDNNVKKRLNDYRKYYGLAQVKKKDIELTKNNLDVKWYQNFCNSLDELLNKRKMAGEVLTKIELDHILWGFTKYPVEVARKKSLIEKVNSAVNS